MKPDTLIQPESVRRCVSFLEWLFRDYGPLDFSVRFWNGHVHGPAPGRTAAFSLVLNHPGALRKMFRPPGDRSLGEAFIFRDFDIEGNLEAAFVISDYFISRKWRLPEMVSFSMSLLSLPKGENNSSTEAAKLSGHPHSPERDQQAIRYHYDVSNDFFKTFLDSRLVYSSGYFSGPDEDLDTAQAGKLDYICRKLRLRPGDRLLDIGCGWGGLLLHAFRNYGARCTGITLSRNQAEFANQKIASEGASNTCEVHLRDYREEQGESAYDKIVSVGMVEHVGEARLREYFTHAWKLLKPGGVFLNHGISQGDRYLENRDSFIDWYVFPDGDILPVNKTLACAEQAGFEIRDVESLREHYMLTLRNWVRRLEENREEALKAAGEVKYRTWKLFMSGSAYGFRTGKVNVYQALLFKPQGGPSGLPLTRADWY